MLAWRTANGGQTWQAEMPYLTRDGRFLTLYGLLNPNVTMLRYPGEAWQFNVDDGFGD
ncbi:MAG: hypothetical protein JW953_23750 [Anaerolineae bacterium]|nr:hypothetical protein [Anaerolineae bacterium]